MKLDAFCERYCLDARSFEEKNARSLALGKERLAAGKTGQAMRLFAYNHALNQNRPKTSAQAGTGTKWKVRVWKNNKVVKTLTVEKDDEASINNKVKSLGVDWDKATVHEPKTMKQQKSYKNANAAKQPSTKSSSVPSSRPAPNGDSVEKNLKSRFQKLISDSVKKGKVIAAKYSTKIRGQKGPYATGWDNGTFDEFRSELRKIFDPAETSINNEGYRVYRELKDPKVVERIKQLIREYTIKIHEAWDGVIDPIYNKADILR